HTPYKKRFNGAVYVLTNAYSFSASGELASLLKTNTNAIFIGEEPGGNSSEIIAGEVVTLVLPNSKVRIRIPIVNQKIHSTSQPADRGVIPDYQIRNSISDMISGRDAILEKTKNLIVLSRE
ncbi:MAG: S41 family peptidase, partial [Bacteroidota bacterium]